MAKKSYSASEKKSFKNGFLTGFKKAKNPKSAKLPVKKTASLKKFHFAGFNENCDCFNVSAYGKDAMSASRNAEKLLTEKCGYRGKIFVSNKPQNVPNPDLSCSYDIRKDGVIVDSVKHVGRVTYVQTKQID